MSLPKTQAPLFGTNPETAAVELIRRQHAPDMAARDIVQPFIILDDSEMFVCTVLGRIRSRDGKGIPISVRIQKDKPTPPPLTFGQSYTNRDAQAAFTEEAACLRTLGTEGEGIIPAVDDPGPLHSLPITYCKKTEQFFHPPCPFCGEWLTDCTDELFLGHLGLPTYATSHERFLWCPSCATSTDEDPVLYTLWRTRRSGNGVVLRFGSELYRSYIETVRREDSEDLPAGLAQFPCRTCEFKSACYPQRVDSADPIPAEDFLYPVAYYEFDAILKRSYELPYGEFARFAGGRNGSELARVPELSAAPDSDNGERHAWYFWGNAPETRSALEILWLKLGAFEQVLEGIRRVTEQCNRPHLGITPEAIRVQPGRLSRWQFTVGLVNPAAARQAVLPSREGIPPEPLYLPLGQRDKKFEPPQLSRSPFGQQLSANVRVAATDQQENRVSLATELTAEKFNALDLRPTDWLRVRLETPSTTGRGIWVWLSDFQPQAGGYRAQGTSAPLRPNLATEVAALAETTLWDCPIQVCRRFGEECDLASAGMVLLCSLLVNDSRDQETVVASITEIADQLMQFGRGSDRDSSAITETFHQLISAHGSAFQSSAILDRALDRQSAAIDIPAPLWDACLAFGFTLCSGIAIAQTQEITEDGKITIKNTLSRLKALNLWAEGQLFARSALQREGDLISWAQG